MTSSVSSELQWEHLLQKTLKSLEKEHFFEYPQIKWYFLSHFGTLQKIVAPPFLHKKHLKEELLLIIDSIWPISL